MVVVFCQIKKGVPPFVVGAIHCPSLREERAMNCPTTNEFTCNSKADSLVPCQVFFVGWVERSETQHVMIKGIMLGFAPLNPTYN